MDIEDSSVPYRAFLRSGSYPALTQRVLRSGGVLAQAAGWFALVVTAASAGYNLAQRLATPSAAMGSESLVRPAPRPALTNLGDVLPSSAQEPIEAAIVHEDGVSAERRAPTRRRTGAIVQAVQPTAAVERSPEATVELASEVTQLQPTLAERVPDPAPEPEPAPVSVQAAPDPIEAVLRESIERQRASTLAMRVRAATSLPTPPEPEPVARPVSPREPVAATARVNGVSVRGPLSAAQLRRSVERVRPTLSECYTEAARRAGQHRNVQVRVTVSIDEAGRVKAQPKVEGAQLPGFGECLSSAMSKLVCQAPDTGTATAAIVVGFKPDR